MAFEYHPADVEVVLSYATSRRARGMMEMYYLEGRTMTEIAKRYGLSRGRVADLIREQGWKIFQAVHCAERATYFTH